MPVMQARSLSTATPEDFRNQVATFNEQSTAADMAERALDLLRNQKGQNIGTLVDLYEHGLQCASRALRDGADEETVVCALLHDVGETLSPINHGEIAGSLLRPYVSPENYWTMIMHEVFQAYYYQDAAGLTEKNTRERFKDHPYYAKCVEFCWKWDQSAFDPDYESLPLENFVPMVHRIFARKPYWHPDHAKDPVNNAKITIADAYPMENRTEVSTAQPTTTKATAVAAAPTAAKL